MFLQKIFLSNNDLRKLKFRKIVKKQCHYILHNDSDIETLKKDIKRNVKHKMDETQ